MNWFRRAVLCDFGSSREVRTNNSDVAIPAAPRRAGATFLYASPEVMVYNRDPTLKSDVWSFGCVIYRVSAAISSWDLGGGGEERTAPRLIPLSDT